MATAGGRFTWMSSDIWNKPWFRSLTDKGKLLWFYLTTCADNSGAGIFQYDTDVVRIKTGRWRGEQWEDALAGLAGHINFYPDNWVWIVGYVKHNYQRVNEKQRKGIDRLVACAPPQLRADFWQEYAPLREGSDTPIIPHRDGYDTLLIQSSPPLPSPAIPYQAKKEGGSGKPSPPPRPTWAAESQALKAIDGYPFDEEKDRERFDGFAELYGQLDLTREVLKWKGWLRDKDMLPLKGQAGPRSRLRNWMKNADAGYGQSRRQESSRQRQAPAVAGDFGKTGEGKL